MHVYRHRIFKRGDSNRTNPLDEPEMEQSKYLNAKSKHGEGWPSIFAVQERSFSTANLIEGSKGPDDPDNLYLANIEKIHAAPVTITFCYGNDRTPLDYGPRLILAGYLKTIGEVVNIMKDSEIEKRLWAEHEINFMANIGSITIALAGHGDVYDDLVGNANANIWKNFCRQHKRVPCVETYRAGIGPHIEFKLKEGCFGGRPAPVWPSFKPKPAPREDNKPTIRS